MENRKASKTNDIAAVICDGSKRCKTWSHKLVNAQREEEKNLVLHIRSSFFIDQFFFFFYFYVLQSE